MPSDPSTTMTDDLHSLNVLLAQAERQREMLNWLEWYVP